VLKIFLLDQPIRKFYIKLANYAKSQYYCNSVTDQSKKKASYITHNDGPSQWYCDFIHCRSSVTYIVNTYTI